ncbi:protein IroB, partial [Streptacidiphilus sp. ASG 303]|uniref:glycosyltransferase n=1 Tax=Streptacidiphilus sp. ASG 303 TaxID=2896847 RepID=UPI00272A27F8|nr:protein IroB [Streptacidiphilus sp. ASG 303]
IGALPPGMRLLEQAPLHLLLPGCDLVVHHGGAGCTMTALAAGVPQLAISNGLDQHVNARRVTAAGAGADLRGHLAGTDAIRTAAAGLLGSAEARASAGRLREQIDRNPSPAELAAALERLAAGAVPSHGGGR